jgi:hypothetical protein
MSQSLDIYGLRTVVAGSRATRSVWSYYPPSLVRRRLCPARRNQPLHGTLMDVYIATVPYPEVHMTDGRHRTIVRLLERQKRNTVTPFSEQQPRPSSKV